MFEQIVRPFQTPTAIPDKVTPVTTVTKVAPQKAHLIWGAVGQPPELFSIGFNVTSKANNHAEKSRKTTEVRVENPDDKSQFLIEDRINNIQFNTNNAAVTAADQTAYKSPSGGSTINSPTVQDNVPAAPSAGQIDSFTLNPG